MNGEQNPQILCRICGQPLDLTSDIVSDEERKPVHEWCYVSRTLSSDDQQADTT
jgi:hypothetical protein